MTSQHRTRAGVVAALAVASLASAAPAGADPNPAQRVQSSSRAAALAQEQYSRSHKPEIPAPGHNFSTIDVREAPDAVAPAGASSFDWGDAAIGAGGALGLALVFAGGAVTVTRRHRGGTGSAATS